MLEANPTNILEFPRLIYILNLIVSLFAMTAAPFAILALYKNLKTVHINLKIISMSMAAFWFLQPVTTAIFLAVLLFQSSDNTITDASQTTLSLATRQIMTVISHCIKTIEVLLSLERILATVYSRVYEKAKSCHFLGIVAVFLCVIVSTLLMIMVTIMHVSFYIVWTFLVSTDIFTFVSLVLLSYYNRRLRQKSATSDVALSQKYQLIENISSIRLFIYSSTIWFTFSITALVMSVITESYMVVGNPYYFAVINMYVVAAAVYWNLQLPRCQRLFSEINEKGGFFTFFCVSRRVCNNEDTVKTTLGQRVKMNFTLDEHFKALRDMWK